MADDAGGAYPMLQFVRGVRLLVFKEDEARASLKSFRPKDAPAARSNPGSIITMGATMRRPIVWRRAGPTSRPWSFETVTAGGPALRAPCPNMIG